jgi:hypothetical protein
VEVEEFEHGDGDGMGVGMEVLGGVVTVDVSNMPYNSLCFVIDSISFSSIAIKEQRTITSNNGACWRTDGLQRSHYQKRAGFPMFRNAPSAQNILEKP